MSTTEINSFSVKTRKKIVGEKSIKTENLKQLKKTETESSQIKNRRLTKVRILIPEDSNPSMNLKYYQG
ncbi:MAG: hypothetical protein ACFFCQ_17265, partial [Promethearchaeota archaeon]